MRLFGNAFTADLETLPHTASSAHTYLWKTKDDDFIIYVVCPKCDSIYEYDDCVVFSEGRKQSKLCRHIAYPNHPHIRRRQECGAQLLKPIKTGRDYKLVPIKEYPYQSLHNSFCYLVRKDGFLSACGGRLSSIPDSHLGNIYDGHVWHDFSSPSAGKFLESPHCYLMTMNVDWFQPFTHTQYSVGANIPYNPEFAS